ncbi:MAG TPA: DUF3105 domain-containing protein [Jatrophihabitans sp.]|nr:DUF3105 domain-containing protein [Jatrophihabitans sp.]
MSKPNRPAGGKNRRPVPVSKSATGKPATAARSADSAATGSTAATPGPATSAPANAAARTTTANRAGGVPGRTGKPVPNRAQSKKIVNKRQTPWGLIITTVVIVALAVGVIFYAVNSGKKKSTANDPNKIPGIVHKTFSSGNHENGVIKYADSPPFGGPHAPVWADCTGTVYPEQIASENAVHDLEHGAVWITYKPGLAASQVDVLTQLVSGQQYMLLTPYAGLKTNISLQAWGYQLFLDSATDPRIKQFITDLRLSQTNTPELGASCTQPAFKSKPSTPGHPIDSLPS